MCPPPMPQLEPPLWEQLAAKNAALPCMAAALLTEEPVVEVAAIEADVVEDPTLPGEIYLIAVRPLCNAYSRRERQQVLELAAEDRRLVDLRAVETAADLGVGAHAFDAGHRDNCESFLAFAAELDPAPGAEVLKGASA